ncbi:MFS transporter [uncultured Shimia sp.]|uniref:MFS transporter n=1 Tax=uncultured Shimia sp. TaxID=573152 RepID=UPI0026053B91|nr:MFS transporter [uncultured Shimia sp.]
MSDNPNRRFGALSEPNYRLFLSGFAFSYTLYWVTLLAIGWWMWEVTGSAAWVGFVFFCDLFPGVLVTPWAAAIADRGNRFRLLKIILWIQVVTGFALAATAWAGALTPTVLCAFVFLEGALIGFSQPAFFGMINRLVRPENLSAAVSLNITVTNGSYIVGPVLAAYVFSFDLGVAPLAFAANALGTLVYLACLARVTLRAEPPREPQDTATLLREILDGMRVFVSNRTVSRAIVLILAAAILQRPLISLMPGINDRFDLFAAHRFTLLTASFMVGSIIASLIHAHRNSAQGLEQLTPKILGILGLGYIAFFWAMSSFAMAGGLAMACLCLIGVGTTFVLAGNNVILQNRTPEHLRSRVLGNSFMLSRTLGALAVISVGFLVEATDFGLSFAINAGLVLVVAYSLLLMRR